MNEIEVKTPIKTQQHADQNQKQEFKLIQSVTIKPGLTWFSFNLVTKELKKIELFKKATIAFDKSVVNNAKATYNPDCVYVQALNEKNAYKHLRKNKVIE